MTHELKTVNFADLEAKSRFASLFPKDIKFLLYVVQHFEPNFDDTDPVSGFSEYKMMHERVLLKLNAYLDLFDGKDPEQLDVNLVKASLPPEFVAKYYDKISEYHKSFIQTGIDQRY